MELLILTSEANVAQQAVETSGRPLVSICGVAVTERIKVPPNNSAIKVSKKQKKGLLFADLFYKKKKPIMVEWQPQEWEEKVEELGDSSLMVSLQR